MYKRARVRLTALYSLLSLSFFWFLSLIIYIWFAQSLGEGYITKVQERNVGILENISIVRIAGSIALDRVRDILFIVNGGLLFFIPAFGWFLTSRTLEPIEEAHEQQKQFISDVSHGVRTPLSILSGEMEVVLQKKRKVLDYKKIIESSKEEIDRLSKLADNLLVLARGEQGKKQIMFEQVDMVDIICNLLYSYRIRIRNKNIIIDFRPPEKTIVVYSQEAMLKTLFSNILDNALKYTKTNGTIRIEIKNTPQYCVVSVKDNGIGIAKAEQKRIFERFYRAHESKKPEIKGYGLGLAIVKAIIDWHKGKIEVISDLGKGAKFTVYLPHFNI